MRRITMCGSTQFKDQIDYLAKELALAGHLVITMNCFGHVDDDRRILRQKQRLDAIHIMKISMSDSIFVVDVNDHIGISTRREIAFAKATGCQVFYLSKGDLAKLKHGDCRL